MKFFAKAATSLEFDKIKDMLAEGALTEGAKYIAARLEPSSDIDEVLRRQRRTTDAVRMSQLKGMPSFGQAKDIRTAAERAGKGAMLSTRELLDVAALLTVTRSLYDYCRSGASFDNSLDEIFMRLTPNKDLEVAINRAILAEDLIADEASPLLSEIRRKIRSVSARVKDILQGYVSGGTKSKYLQENIITTRAGRYVVPVKAEYRNEVKGLIHDTSSTGATLFVEPMSVVEANNELRELESREAREIERILFAFSAKVAENEHALSLNYMNITELAFIFSCAALSARMNASAPRITDKREIILKNARHPLLDRDKVVPITVKLGVEAGYNMLVITGPNTGGKTVALKTLGLFSMMAQAGLHTPADEAVICPFDEIYADIGDEQSIEQSLSTFSAHMVGIVSIIDSMTKNSLVLFDELGAGTDPVEGAALAMAVLEEVRIVGALCAATTHYAELKAYAIETDNVQNAACEFDVNTLKPTYRLIIGAPGKSNAFAISTKLGLPADIVKRAENFVDTGSRNFEDVIAKLEATRIELEEKLAEAKSSELAFRQYKQKIEGELKKKLEDAEKESAKLKTEAKKLLDGAKATSNYVFEELDALKKQKDAENFAERLSKAKRDVRASVRDMDSSVDPVKADDDEDYVLPRELKKGDAVRHRNLGMNGMLLDDPDKNGNCTVKMGSIKTKANIKDLKLLGESVEQDDKKARDKERAAYRLNVSRSFKPELDLRGMTGEDAWFSVDKYLDDAKIASVNQVTLIHGKGTGALRASIWNQLRRDGRVAEFRAGAWGEGDYGVTVVTLK